MNIEDDLSASPVRLRAEIRRLRALLPEGAGNEDWFYKNEKVTRDLIYAKINELLSIFPECEGDEALYALRAAGINYFCGVIHAGGGCACTGSCEQAARDVLDKLREDGHAVVRLKIAT